MATTSSIRTANKCIMIRFNLERFIGYRVSYRIERIAFVTIVLNIKLNHDYLSPNQ